MDNDLNGTINTRLTIVNVQNLSDGGERITVAPNDTTGSGFKASGSIDLTFTDITQLGLYKAGDVLNVTFAPVVDVLNRQRSAKAAEHISTR